jgi:hypothetical protein
MTKFFFQTDTEDLFEKNLKKVSLDWEYRTKPITYKFNKLGHRAIELEELDLNNYFLTTGCSQTQGVGLRLEDTYSHVVSKELNKPYYNLALAGSGNDLIFYNLINWLTIFPNNQPKFILLQWSEDLRYSIFSKLGAKPFGSWSDKDPMLLTDKSEFYFVNKSNWLRSMIDLVFKCPIYHIFWDAHNRNKVLTGDSFFEYLEKADSNNLPFDHIENAKNSFFEYIERIQTENLIFDGLDRARDFSHSGSKSNLDMANKILKKINI